MNYRPYPNRDRALRQLARRGTIAGQAARERSAALYPLGQYRISTR